MEKNTKTSQTKPMTSIVRKLHWRLILTKAGTMLKMDVLLWGILFFGYLVQKEWEKFGEFAWEYKRRIVDFGNLKACCYVVWDSAGEKLLTLELYPVFRVLGWLFVILFGLQLLGIIGSYTKEERKIRNTLAPINALAMKAEELSKLAFTEEKYQRIEDAISHLEPQESQMLSFGDSDLKGIETAMNNLLVRMRETYKQQARFVNDASHELRTPIAVIEGYVNMIARWGREDEKVLDESIAALQRESGHMKKLVEQLLFLARGDSGKTQLEISQISIRECMQEIYEESLLIDEDHVYRYHPEEDILVNADPQMLKQAVRILVDNAAKYTEKNDEILLSIGRNEEGHPYMQVQDTGIGMASADVEHMFERFYRSDDVRKMKGTGLGLSIAKWIIDKHGGHFEILSRTELGTRIRVIL